MPVGRVGAELYPGDVAARYRNRPRGLTHPTRKRAGETAPSEYEDRASRQPIATSFGAGDEYRGFNHWYRFPTPFCLASGPGALAADRSYIVEGRLSPDAAPPAPVLPSSFSRPLRRPGAGPHTRPVIRRLVAQTRLRREAALSACAAAVRPWRARAGGWLRLSLVRREQASEIGRRRGPVSHGGTPASAGDVEPGRWCESDGAVLGTTSSPDDP
jgi:hypothetical protein